MKISVIVPVYNVEAYLEKCLQSIIDQNYQQLEIILVNDGSTDSSAEICEKFAKRDNRIIIIHQKNTGVSAARNTAIKVATGDYITFVDSDDWIDQKMYHEMIRVVSANSYPSVVMCDFVEEMGNTSVNISSDLENGYYDKRKIIEKIYPTLLVTENLGRVPIVSACSCLFKKELLNDSIDFDIELRFAEDYLFMAKVMIAAESFFYCKGFYFYHYRQYQESRSKFYQPQWWRNLLLLNDRLKIATSDNADYNFGKQIKLQLIHSALFVSSSIYQNSNLHKNEKLLLLKEIFNEPALIKVFKSLSFNKQPVVLKILLYIVRQKWVSGYWLLRKLTS